MNHAKTKQGHVLKAGNRVLIPATVANISPTPGKYDTKVILDDRVDNTPTEVILNSSQVELHPDETPAEEIADTPGREGGVKDSLTGFVEQEEQKRKESAPLIPGTPQHVLDELAAKERNEKQAQLDAEARQQRDLERLAAKAEAEAKALAEREKADQAEKDEQAKSDARKAKETEDASKNKSEQKDVQ